MPASAFPVLFFLFGTLYLGLAGVCVFLMLRRRSSRWLLIPTVLAVAITAASLLLHSIRPFGLLLVVGFFPFVFTGGGGKKRGG